MIIHMIYNEAHYVSYNLQKPQHGVVQVNERLQRKCVTVSK